MKKFLVQVDIGEGYPYYTFMLQAKTQKQAEKKAYELEKQDYNGLMFNLGDVYLHEINTLDDIIKHLAI